VRNDGAEGRNPRRRLPREFPLCQIDHGQLIVRGQRHHGQSTPPGIRLARDGNRARLVSPQIPGHDRASIHQRHMRRTSACTPQSGKQWPLCDAVELDPL
jgi:hypothetical protein